MIRHGGGGESSRRARERKSRWFIDFRYSIRSRRMSIKTFYFNCAHTFALGRLTGDNDFLVGRIAMTLQTAPLSQHHCNDHDRSVEKKEHFSTWTNPPNRSESQRFQFHVVYRLGCCVDVCASRGRRWCQLNNGNSQQCIDNRLVTTF